MEFGERLSQLRKCRGISQEELAEKLNVSRQSISKWERGEAQPELSNLTALCEALGVSPNELLGYASVQEQPKDSGSGESKQTWEAKRRSTFRETCLMIAGVASAAIGALTHLVVAVLSSMIRVHVMRKVTLDDGTVMYEGGSNVLGYDYTEFVQTYRLQAILWIATLLLVGGVVLVIWARCKKRGITVRAWLRALVSRIFRKRDASESESA